jgi:glycosyltransferase involved in cell wall biosynthesis
MNEIQIVTLFDDSLSAAEKKGNLEHVIELFNPSNYLKQVHHICFRAEDNKIKAKIKNSGFTLHVLKTTRPFLPFLWVLLDFPLCLLQILYIVKKNKICLVRGYAPSYASFFGLLISRLTNLPFVVSVGGDHRLAMDLTGKYPVFNYRPIHRRIEEAVLRNADLVICPNLFSVHYVTKIGTLEKRTIIIPWSMKKDVFNFTYKDSNILLKSGIDLSKPIILYVSRLEKDKQVEVLFDAIPLIIKDYPDAQFVFIGDGSLMGFCKNRVCELGISKNTYFLGYQNQEIIKYCIKQVTLVWIPMSGLVILESAAAAKPIIAFDIEWHSEFIENNKNGLLVENRNYEKLAEATIALLKDRELANRLGNMAYKTLKEKYNPVELDRMQVVAVLSVLKLKKKLNFDTDVFNEDKQENRH